MNTLFLKEVRQKAGNKMLFLPHAISRMNLPQRLISPLEVCRVIFEGQIIEDYPEDARGHSCLMAMFIKESSRMVHVICTPKDEYLAIISAYIPLPTKWERNLKTRKR